MPPPPCAANHLELTLRTATVLLMSQLELNLTTANVKNTNTALRSKTANLTGIALCTVIIIYLFYIITVIIFAPLCYCYLHIICITVIC